VKKLLLSTILAAMAFPAAASAEALNAEQKKEIEAMIHEYILNHGDVVIEAVNKYQAKQEEESNKQAEEAAADLITKLRTDKDIAQTGNPDGDVIVVEFFDYNCGWCKKAFEEIQTLLKEDKNVKVVLYDIPILGPTSHLASRWALAAKKQGKYWDFHKAVITHEGSIDEEVLAKLAKEAGVDVDKLKKDLEDPSIDAELKSHLEVTKSLGIQGTPGFLVNEKVFRGYVPYDTLTGAIKEAREAKKE
jgi:protein-disulfide isomerase